MSTTETQIATLTAEDVKAVQKADQVVLRHYQGATTMEVYLDRRLVDEPRIYTESEQRLFPVTDDIARERARIITVRGAVNSYEEDAPYQCDITVASCFWMSSSAQYDDVWRTIASLMKPGTDVQVAFVGNAKSNGHTKTNGLHGDAVRIYLTPKGAQRPLVFLVDVSVGRDDSARMVKPRG